MVRELVERGHYQSALTQIEEENLDTISTDLLKVEIHRELGSEDEAWRILEAVKKQVGTERYEIAILVEEAYLFYRENRLELAMQVIRDIRDKFPSLENLETTEERIAFVKSYSVAGNIAWRLNQFNEMKSQYERALELSQEINHSYSLIHALIGLGNVTKSRGEWLSAISYYNAGLFAATGSSNSKFEAYCRNNLGEVFRVLGRIDDAIFHFDLANDYFSGEMALGPMSVTNMNLGLCYFIKEQSDVALGYFNYALMLAKEVNYKYQICDIFIHMLFVHAREDNDTGIAIIYDKFLQMFHTESDELFKPVRMLIEGVYHLSQKSLKDKVKAQNIFERLAEMQFESDYKILVLIYLIEIKIDEFLIYNQPQELEEVIGLFNKLDEDYQLRPLFKLRVLMLRAKLEELRGLSSEAMAHLKSALSIAKQYGLESQKYEIVDSIHLLNKRETHQKTDSEKTDITKIDEDVIDTYLELLKKYLRV